MVTAYGGFEAAHGGLLVEDLSPLLVGDGVDRLRDAGMSTGSVAVIRAGP